MFSSSFPPPQPFASQLPPWPFSPLSSLLSDAVHTRVEIHKMDSEMSGLVE